ncbi:MAG: FecR domain-containing protein [Chitinophagaceae bacterium]|nr:FecR domain-containing protein [Chitinophagaceae bacterium]
MDQQRFIYLLERRLDQSITGEEDAELTAFLRASGFHEEMVTTEPEINPERWDKYIDQILAADKVIKIASPEGGRIRLLKRHWRWWAAAAVFIAGISTAAMVFLTGKKQEPASLADAGKQRAQDVLPGRDRAELTLSDGRKILLDSAQGSLLQDGELKVINRHGSLDYNGNGDSVVYHTLSTPRGGQYKVQLPDGTDVWLDAASSITYPTAFSGKERRVTITGQVYFEVIKDVARPFFVKVNDMEVEVLGTHFNINSYMDEGAIKTTLLQGSVRVSRAGSQVILSPGQQAQAGDGIPLRQVQNADVEQVTAWKNGRFNFNGVDLRTIMFQLARWYDITVKYEKKPPLLHFKGELPRDLTLSQVLATLRDMEVRCHIDGRTLIIE